MTEVVGIEVAALVGEACHVVRFVEMVERLLLVEQTVGIFDAEGVDIFGEGGTMLLVDSVDDIVLGDA